MSQGEPVLFWVQHLLGAGHLRRALAVAAALAGKGFDVTVASGGPPMPWPTPAGVALVQLPALRAADERFSGLVDVAGRPVGEALWAARERKLTALLQELRPQVVLTEMFPFGRRGLRAEILPLLERAGGLRPPARIVATVRDILVGKDRPERWREMRDLAREWYDLVLVHGDPALVALDESFPLAAEIADLTRYTGLVLTARPEPDSAQADAVIVSAGGGAVGHRLLETAILARRLSRLADRPWRLVAGANLSGAEHAAIAARLPAGVVLERHLENLPSRMAASEVSVSQAGYNTVAEGLAGRARMVLVPFDAAGQDEQTRRAARLAERGLALMVPPAALTPERLAEAIDRAAAQPRPGTGHLRFDGATEAAAAVRALVDGAGP
jgi:predicted glycosyltransferase